MTIRPLLEAAAPARVVIFLSGSGSNAERILESWRRADGNAPFTPVALVTDAPDTSRAADLARSFDLPLVARDIRAFYRDHGETRVSLATDTGRRLRREWTDLLRGDLREFRPDFGVLAGFVPLTNLTGDFPCLNVHPGDLLYLRDGRRYLVGLHTVPVERAILEGLTSLRSSVIQALPYTGGGGDMDNGPLLGISEPVPVDLKGEELQHLHACRETRPPARPRGGYGDALEAVAALNLERLKRMGDWVVFPKVVHDFAGGRFGTDSTGGLWYRLSNRWQPVETVVYGEHTREILFRSPAGGLP